MSIRTSGSDLYMSGETGLLTTHLRCPGMEGTANGAQNLKARNRLRTDAARRPNELAQSEVYQLRAKALRLRVTDVTGTCGYQLRGAKRWLTSSRAELLGDKRQCRRPL